MKLSVVFIFIILMAAILRSGHNENRIVRLEKIVGTEAPASMTWTNGHIYTTLVKHSHNCGCVKK